MFVILTMRSFAVPLKYRQLYLVVQSVNMLILFLFVIIINLIFPHGFILLILREAIFLTMENIGQCQKYCADREQIA